MTNGSDGTDIDVVNQNFASPKRKDCKLDMGELQLQTNGRATKPLSVHTATAAITNGKRNHRNVGGTKTKKVPQAITKYFHTNGHSVSNGSLNKSTSDADVSIDLSVETDVTTLPNGDVDVKKNDFAIVNVDDKTTTVPIPNGCVLMSPETKSLQNGVKQTTPHRMVVRSSPTKKQRLYVKDPVEVFSNLNIRDGATKTGRKGQKIRRKLIVSETKEHSENGTNVNDQKSGKDEQSIVVNGSTNIPSIVDKSLSKLSEKIAAKNDENFSVPNNAAPRRVQNTQLTDFFPIRRSGRKTQKVVEQEQSRHIDMAIEKQLEDGLVVKMFPEKGRGIVAGRDFQRGEFVVEYIGELIDQTEADRREESYSQMADFGCYMYYFKHKEQQWW